MYWSILHSEKLFLIIELLVLANNIQGAVKVPMNIYVAKLEETGAHGAISGQLTFAKRINAEYNVSVCVLLYQVDDALARFQAAWEIIPALNPKTS